MTDNSANQNGQAPQGAGQSGYWQGTYQPPSYSTPPQQGQQYYAPPQQTAQQGAQGASGQQTAQPGPQYAAGQQAAQQGTQYAPDQQAYQQAYQQGYQQAYQQYANGYVRSRDHVAAGLLAIFLGALGIHKFYLGYNQAGFIMLAVTIIGSILTFGLAGAVMCVIAFIEGIIYLTKSQQEFDQMYVVGKKEWF